jgi:hypothetical protein
LKKEWGCKALVVPQWDRIKWMLMVPKWGGPVPEKEVGKKNLLIP